MSGRGKLTHTPLRHLRILFAAQIIWFVTIASVVAWWGWLLYQQSKLLAVLQPFAGTLFAEGDFGIIATPRMLLWEAAVIFVFILATTGAFAWLYWSELKRSRSIEGFLAAWTHELRTPLSSIRLQAEAIADGKSTPEQQDALLKRLLEDTTRLESQVERALELARIEGGANLLLKPVPIKQVVNRTLNSWRETAQKPIQLQVDINDAVVLADQFALQTILRNLLDNTVRHGRSTDQIIQVRSVVDGDKIHIIYQDNGCGFVGDTKNLGKLFHKGAESQGAGVGLYLIQTLMDRMGGHVKFSSPQGFQADMCFKVEDSHA